MRPYCLLWAKGYSLLELSPPIPSLPRSVLSDSVDCGASAVLAGAVVGNFLTSEVSEVFALQPTRLHTRQQERAM